jgi:hypothetical protein
MLQCDFYHIAVRNALIKDGWTITDDLFTIEFKGLRLYADLGAEKRISREVEERRIAIEVKVFNRPSLISELEKAVGQCVIYRSLLSRVDPERKLFLAVSEIIFQDFFQRRAVQVISSDQQINLLIFDSEREAIVQWIE